MANEIPGAQVVRLFRAHACAHCSSPQPLRNRDCTRCGPGSRGARRARCHGPLGRIDLALEILA
jgi:hypothetical protein